MTGVSPPQEDFFSNLLHAEKFVRLSSWHNYLDKQQQLRYISMWVSTRPLGRVYVFLGYDPSADG
jgi:hypothetical protein